MKANSNYKQENGFYERALKESTYLQMYKISTFKAIKSIGEKIQLLKSYKSKIRRLRNHIKRWVQAYLRT